MFKVNGKSEPLEVFHKLGCVQACDRRRTPQPLPLMGLKKLKKESCGICLVTVRVVPLPLCFCFFLMVFTVTSLPFCQQIWHLGEDKEKKSYSFFLKYSFFFFFFKSRSSQKVFLPLAVHYLSALKGEGVCSIGLSLHLVQLGEDCVAEVAVGLKVELQCEALFREEQQPLAQHHFCCNITPLYTLAIVTTK